MKSYSRSREGRFCSNKKLLYKFDKKLLDHLLREKINTEFINTFWGIKLNENDERILELFSKCIKLRILGLSALSISRKIGISKSTVSKWIWKISIPEVIQLLEYYIKSYNIRKENIDKQLISLTSTKGAKLKGPWITVPEKITEQEIKTILLQIKPNKKFYNYASKFKIPNADSLKTRTNLFAFLLGVMIGDAGKIKVKLKRWTNRRITLSLTKKYSSNKRFGEFVSLCIFNLGLNVNQIKDDGPNIKSKHYFYRWYSQSSPLINWLFRVCLGLKDDEVTTYTPIRADWLLNTSRDFRIWFLQGLADSDGYVDFNTHLVGIVTKPNKSIIVKLLDSLGAKCRLGYLHKGTMNYIVIPVRDASKLPFFNPFISNYRYTQMETLAKAKRFSHHWPKWFSNVVDRYIKDGLRPSEIIKKILSEYNIAIRQSGIYKRKQKWRKK